MGLEGFIWWIGVVEDRQDPEQLGRVRVRCFGWHTDNKSKIDTDALPWAHPIIPVNSPAFNTPKEGDMVFGFFIDGENAQNPAIVGILPGVPNKQPDYSKGFSDPGKSLSGRPKKPDDQADKYPKSKYLKEPTFNRLSRGKTDSTIIATRKKNLKKNVKSAGGQSWSEPDPSFKPKYPYNNSYESESGHALEFDDTPGNERVQLAHRVGAYMEFDKNGTKIERVQKDNYSVIMGDDFIYVKGKAVITVDGDFNLKTSKINIEASAINMAASGAIKIKGSAVNIESTGDMNLKAGGAGNLTSGKKLSLKGKTAALGGMTVDIPAAKVGLQSGSVSTASGAGISGGGTNAAGQTPEEEAAALEEVSVTGKRTETGDGLEEVSVTGKRVGETEQKKTLLGKIKDGITATVNQVTQTLGGFGDEIISDFKNGLPLNTIKLKVEGFADSINNNKAAILGLDKLPQRLLYGKVDEVSELSYTNNVDFKLDKSIQSSMKSVLYGIVENKLNNVIAKHIYPKTETLNIPNTEYANQYADVLERYAAQELDPEITITTETVEVPETITVEEETVVVYEETNSDDFTTQLEDEGEV